MIEEKRIRSLRSKPAAWPKLRYGSSLARRPTSDPPGIARRRLGRTGEGLFQVLWSVATCRKLQPIDCRLVYRFAIGELSAEYADVRPHGLVHRAHGILHRRIEARSKLRQERAVEREPKPLGLLHDPVESLVRQSVRRATAGSAARQDAFPDSRA
jgi:hypothetical protein